jgi:hypothetical protein
MSAPKGTGRVRIDDRGNSVWEFSADNGETTVRTERVLALGDELSLVQTGLHDAIDKPPTPVARPAAAPAAPARPSPPAFSAIETKPPRKPMSRQELQKLSDEIVRQRQLREAMKSSDR